jgi:uncharacterized spore protein YtfJ
MVMKKVTIQILKLKGNKKQAKYDQKITTVLKIIQKTRTEKQKKKQIQRQQKQNHNIKNKPKSKYKNNESRRLKMR